MANSSTDCGRLDRRTSHALQRGIGDRLRQTMNLDEAEPSARLTRLIEELRRQDEDAPPRPAHGR